MKNKNNRLAIILAVLAIILAAYATYATYNLKKENLGAEVFKANVFEAIDAYVAEKSGQPTGPVDVSIDDDPMKGDKNAAVTIVEFTDYQCPFCGRYANETMPEIVKNYVDTGKVRYVLRDFPLGGHPNAGPAANAAECLREQGGDGMYFEYHDILFSHQEDLSVEKLKEFAAGFDVDQTQFATCVDENKYESEIAKDFADGGKYGVRGTPAFFINGIPLSGAQPFENFKAAIEQALSE
ncbi:DsbA family protein [Patescibacteria group bacterium]|nr:DsbA family protein [Patescibacteria group bacterium]MBU1015940.1 DsbA family protein [Patescibacteria group bacterium]MBU1685499.1 DsbA family protein [Patescibacteria group bacterium]MBU1938693.1 DsbA family protein [Patescibacteria group bacterium]